jgi:hypothetical protein
MHLGQAEARNFHCILCRFMSGTNWEHQHSSILMTLCTCLPFLSIQCKRSQSTCLLHCSWSLLTSLVTIFAQTFFIPKFSFKINRSLSLDNKYFCNDSDSQSFGTRYLTFYYVSPQLRCQASRSAAMKMYG